MTSKKQPRIEALTPEQIARMPQYVEEWTRIGLSTEPADRPRAEAAINAMYAQAGIAAPRIVWCSSPLAMGMTCAIVQKIGADKDIGKKVRASVWDSVGASVWASVGASVGASIYGQHDAGWLAFYSYFALECGLVEQTQKLRGLWELANSAGWALPHEKICWVSERHNVVKRDDRGRLHCENGPALSHVDGWAIHAWHGVRIPAEWIEDRKTLTAAVALKTENVEQRRAACEILGWASILQELDARTVDVDADPEIGTLLEVTLPDAGNERFLRVLCGTKREFALPVPREMKTALEANAWTFGFDKDSFVKPEVRT